MQMRDGRRAFADAVYIKATESAPPFSLHDPLPQFRRTFTVSEAEVAEGLTLYIQCPSFADVRINGCAISDDRFISAVSDFSKLLWYDTYDVTHLVRVGENVFSLTLGNGFFNESFETPWNFDQAPWRDAPQFLLALWSAERCILVSDRHFRTRPAGSHILFSHLRSGEHVDMRAKTDAWMHVGFDDSTWREPYERAIPQGAVLRPIPCAAVRECEQIHPVTVTPTARGFLVDFGSTQSGYIEMALTAERGTEVRFYYAEQVSDGEPIYNYNAERDARALYPMCPYHMDMVITSGKEDVFKPTFVYHGFRYVLIEGLSSPPPPSSIVAHFTHQNISRTSSFSSSDEILNYIYEAGIRSTYSNMFWMLTDCPTREKLGWANDAAASLRQTLINFDIRPLYEKWFEDIKAAMTDEGALPGIIPSSGWGFRYGPVCDCLLFELPYRIYLYTADATMMTGAIPYFERYTDFLYSCRCNGKLFNLGDWMGTHNNERIPVEFIQEFYLLNALRITRLAHALAGTCSTRHNEWYQVRRAAFLRDYLTPDGTSVIAEQTAVAILLMNGLCEDAAPLREQMRGILARDGYRITSGMVGSQYVYDALSQCDCVEEAYQMLTESVPGYKGWHSMGATTLWECWRGERFGSHNHHMYSGVIAWFYTSLLGIEPSEEHPGFVGIELHPRFVRSLRFVKGHFETVHGRIEAEWRFDDRGVRYTVCLPEGMEATYRGERLSAGVHSFYHEEGLA